jgi:uncharacterized protein
MPQHLMLVPSLACPAECQYCFGPHEGGAPMRRETIAAIVRWQQRLVNGDALEIRSRVLHVIIAGKDISLQNKQTELFNRYMGRQ